MKKKEIMNVLKNYGFELKKFYKFPKGVSQDNYYVETNDGPFVLRVYKKKEWLKGVNMGKHLGYEIKILRKLNDHGVPVANPILNLQNEYINKIGDRLAVLFEFLKGKHPQKINDNHIFQIGNVLSQMHLITKDTKPLKSRGFIDEKFLVDLKKNHFTKKNMHKKWKNKFENWEKLIDETIGVVNLPEELPMANIHEDIGADNVFFRRGKLTAILDFDDCYYGFMINDIATALEMCGYKRGVLDKKRFKLFIKSYEKNRKLAKLEKKHLWDSMTLNMAKRLIYCSEYDFKFYNIYVEKRLGWLLKNKEAVGSYLK